MTALLHELGRVIPVDEALDGALRDAESPVDRNDR